MCKDWQSDRMSPLGNDSNLRVGGVILAGGRGTRMGGADKGLLTLAGRALLAHVADRLAPQCAALAINANGDAARFAAFDLPVLPDPIDGFAGPLAGVLAGLDWAREKGFDGILTAAADSPFLPSDLDLRLVGDGVALAADAEGNLHPTFGYWPTSARDGLRTLLKTGERKVRLVADRLGAVTVPFPAADPDPFFNINKPEDLAHAERMIQR